MSLPSHHVNQFSFKNFNVNVSEQSMLNKTQRKEVSDSKTNRSLWLRKVRELFVRPTSVLRTTEVRNLVCEISTGSDTKEPQNRKRLTHQRLPHFNNSQI